MRDTLGALVVLGVVGGGAAGGDVVIGMSGDHETFGDFLDFRGVRERAGFRMDLRAFVGEAGNDVMEGGVTGGGVTGGGATGGGVTGDGVTGGGNTGGGVTGGV